MSKMGGGGWSTTCEWEEGVGTTCVWEERGGTTLPLLLNTTSPVTYMMHP